MTHPHDHDPSQESERKDTPPHSEMVIKFERIAEEAGTEAVHDCIDDLLKDSSPENEQERILVREAIAAYMRKDFIREATHEGSQLTSQLQNGAMEAYSITELTNQPQNPEMLRLGDTLRRVSSLEARSSSLIQETTRQKTLDNDTKSGEKPIPDTTIKKFTELFEDGADEARRQFSQDEADWTQLDKIVETLKPLGEQFALLRHFTQAIEESSRQPQAVAIEIPRIRQSLLDLRQHLARSI